MAPLHRCLPARALPALALLALALVPLRAQAPTASIGQRYGRLQLLNVFVIDGMGNPLRGPLDLTIEGSKILSVQPSRPSEFSGSQLSTAPAARPADRVIDGTGMYVMPGIIDMHGHVQFSRGNTPMPRDYVYKLWLSHGITTVRGTLLQRIQPSSTWLRDRHRKLRPR